MANLALISHDSIFPLMHIFIQNGQNALHLAAAYGHVDIVRSLAPKLKSLVHSMDNNGFTMLHWAVWAGNAEVVQLVIEEFQLECNARDKVSV